MLETQAPSGRIHWRLHFPLSYFLTWEFGLNCLLDGLTSLAAIHVITLMTVEVEDVADDMLIGLAVHPASWVELGDACAAHWHRAVIILFLLRSDYRSTVKSHSINRSAFSFSSNT